MVCRPAAILLRGAACFVVLSAGGRGGATIRPSLRHGVLEGAVAYVPNPISNQHSERATAATNITDKC